MVLIRKFSEYRDKIFFISALYETHNLKKKMCALIPCLFVACEVNPEWIVIYKIDITFTVLMSNTAFEWTRFNAISS